MHTCSNNAHAYTHILHAFSNVCALTTNLYTLTALSILTAHHAHIFSRDSHIHTVKKRDNVYTFIIPQTRIRTTKQKSFKNNNIHTTYATQREEPPAPSWGKVPWPSIRELTNMSMFARIRRVADQRDRAILIGQIPLIEQHKPRHQGKRDAVQGISETDDFLGRTDGDGTPLPVERAYPEGEVVTLSQKTREQQDAEAPMQPSQLFGSLQRGGNIKESPRDASDVKTPRSQVSFLGVLEERSHHEEVAVGAHSLASVQGARIHDENGGDLCVFGVCVCARSVCA
jgi:hypothetical protein